MPKVTRKIQYSVDPRILSTTSIDGEDYYEIDGCGHMTKTSAPTRAIRFFGVDLSAIDDTDIVIFLLTPIEPNEVPSEARRFLKSRRGTVGIELADFEFHLFAVLPNLNGEPGYLAYVDREHAAAVLTSQGNFE